MLDYLCYDLIVRLLRSSKPKKLLLGDTSLDKTLKNVHLQIQRPFFYLSGVKPTTILTRQRTFKSKLLKRNWDCYFRRAFRRYMNSESNGVRMFMT